MKSLFDDSNIELSCPHCSHKFSERIGKLRTNPHLACPSCGNGITIEAKQLDATLKGVDQRVADLRRSLRNFGK
jgi:uncharacterized Zn finger protein